MPELRHVPHERDHDLGLHFHALGCHVAGRLEDCTRLHLGDLGVGDAEAAATVPEHRVRLREGLHRAAQLLHQQAGRLGEVGDLRILVR